VLLLMRGAGAYSSTRRLAVWRGAAAAAAMQPCRQEEVQSSWRCVKVNCCDVWVSPAAVLYSRSYMYALRL
jgi:hypothetical protein